MSKRPLAVVVALLSSIVSLPGQASGLVERIAAAPGAAAPSTAADNPAAVTFPGLTRYVDIHGFYSVLMRGDPNKAGQFELGGNIKYSAASIEDKQGTWTVGYVDMPDIGQPPYDSKKLSEIINGQTNAYIEKIHGKMQVFKARSRFGNQFREAEGRIDSGTWKDGKFRLNAYLAGRRMYIIAVAGKEAWTKSSQSDAFLNSFEVPGATASPKLDSMSVNPKSVTPGKTPPLGISSTPPRKKKQ